jgi:cytochrome c oxidase subunit III
MSERRVLDVSKIPSIVFDHQNIVWWGTIGFILIEGFTLVLMGASFFYLRMNELEWPPGRTPPPDVTAATINAILILLIIIPMRLADQAARHYDKARVVMMLSIAAAMTSVAIVLRWFELDALNVRWDAHAYGSATWGLLVLHATLLVADLAETLVFIGFFLLGRAQMKHYPDVSDAALYQYFLSAVNIPVYLIVFWGPHLF